MEKRTNLDFGQCISSVVSVGASNHGCVVARRIVGILGWLHRGFQALRAQRCRNPVRNFPRGSVAARVDNKDSHAPDLPPLEGHSEARTGSFGRAQAERKTAD